MINIIKNEWKILSRNKVFIYLNLLFVLSLITIVILGITQTSSQKAIQNKAKEHIRQKWESLEAMNPHRAAHYGSYAFKEPNLLNSMDGGINDITGNVIKLEGHVQNEILYSEASQSLSISKFGKLKSSLLLQYVIPLILIFLAYGSVSSEKESERLKQLILQGISLEKLTFAKSISVFIYGVIMLLITLSVQILFSKTDLETSKRLIFIMTVYSVYYYIICSLATFFSARFKNNTSSLSSILAIWIIWTIFLPKIWGNAVEKIYPLPSRQVFKATMKEERSKGIDGHNPYDIRREKLKNKYLKLYEVDSLKNLPINFDGIVMQEDEEYGNIVWDKHFGKNYKILQKQKLFYQLSGFINPFASLQSTSMGFCGTDMLHHLDFLEKSENYRRYFIKSLNDKHAFGGAKTGDWKWTVDSTFFKSVKDFSYNTPEIENYYSNYSVDLLFLLWWIIITTTLIRFKTNKELFI